MSIRCVVFIFTSGNSRTSALQSTTRLGSRFPHTLAICRRCTRFREPWRTRPRPSSWLRSYSRTRRRVWSRFGNRRRRFPGAIRTRAVDVVERVGERLADGERDARRAARECLKRGIVPALGVDGLAPFAKILILYAGAALTHVADGVRKDAPAALDALLDAAPELVAAHAPASTLGHLGELLRRGDDGGVGTGSSVRRGVGSQKPATRLALLKSCRRFLETLVRDESDDALTSSTSSSATTFEWGEVARNGASTRSIGSMYASRARRAPASVLAVSTAVSEESESTAGSAAACGSRSSGCCL